MLKVRQAKNTRLEHSPVLDEAKISADIICSIDTQGRSLSDEFGMHCEISANQNDHANIFLIQLNLKAFDKDSQIVLDFDFSHSLIKDLVNKYNEECGPLFTEDMISTLIFDRIFTQFSFFDDEIYGMWLQDRFRAAEENYK